MTGMIRTLAEGRVDESFYFCGKYSIEVDIKYGS